jgi:hypothetical protein
MECDFETVRQIHGTDRLAETEGSSGFLKGLNHYYFIRLWEFMLGWTGLAQLLLYEGVSLKKVSSEKVSGSLVLPCLHPLSPGEPESTFLCESALRV